MKSHRAIIDSMTKNHFPSALTLNVGPAGSVWGIVPNTALRYQRFQKFIQQLPHLLAKVDPPVRVVLCCIGYEA